MASRRVELVDEGKGALRFAKVDANQAEIVRALRAVGATVQSLASVGNGCPDLLVGYKGATWLFEIKDGRRVKSERKLTPKEATWARSWTGGPFTIVECVEDALSDIGCRVRT